MTRPDPQPPRQALVLGITGAIGSAIAGALARRGYAIHALARDPDRAGAALARKPSPSIPVAWHRGDALDRDAVVRAARGCSLIVHGVNPPGYRRWREDGLPMLDGSIAAAEATGARLLFPGNVYVFAPGSGALLDETVPHAPTTRKGGVRRDIEARLREAGGRGVRSLTVRAGDFFGPGVENSWFSQALAKGGPDATVVRMLGRPAVGHSWAYVPDLAETFARLVEREASLATCEIVHFEGHWLDPGRGLAEAVQKALQPRRVPIRPFPWWTTILASPFVPFLREVQEMRWLWEHPLRLDNRKLRSLIGHEPHTPLPDAVAAALGIDRTRPAPDDAVAATTRI